MTDLIERAMAALEGYTDDDIKDSEHLSFASLAVAAGELADRLDAKLRLCCGGTDADRAALARFRAIVEGKE